MKESQQRRVKREDQYQRGPTIICRCLPNAVTKEKRGRAKVSNCRVRHRMKERG